MACCAVRSPSGIAVCRQRKVNSVTGCGGAFHITSLCVDITSVTWSLLCTSLCKTAPSYEVVIRQANCPDKSIESAKAPQHAKCCKTFATQTAWSSKRLCKVGKGAVRKALSTGVREFQSAGVVGRVPHLFIQLFAGIAARWLCVKASLCGASLACSHTRRLSRHQLHPPMPGCRGLRLSAGAETRRMLR